MHLYWEWRFFMENTTKARAFDFTKKNRTKIRTRLARGLAILAFALVVSHGTVMDGYFPAAVALTAYLAARKPLNALIAVPAAAAIAPYLMKGYDPWGDMAAVLVCALFFPVAGKVRFRVWQVGLIAASAGIVCISLSRVATSTVYKISPEKLLVYGALIFAIVIIADVICSIVGELWPVVSEAENGTVSRGSVRHDFASYGSDRQNRGASHSVQQGGSTRNSVSYINDAYADVSHISNADFGTSHINNANVKASHIGNVGFNDPNISGADLDASAIGYADSRASTLQNPASQSAGSYGDWISRHMTLLADGKYEKELRIAALISAVLMILNGAGLSFLAWPLILFMAMTALDSSSAGAPFIVIATGGVWAALIGQGQWGLLATAVIGAAAAVFVKRLGIFIRTAAFIAVCWTMGFMESGTVLGADGYCLFVAAALFAVVSWKFRPAVKRLIAAIEGNPADAGETSAFRTAALLQSKSDDMQELAELYATYVDSRSALASQFHMTKQIMDDVRYRISRRPGAARSSHSSIGSRAKSRREKLAVDISASQYAASGTINGDCCGWQDIGDGRTVMVVSDGMGKGKKAAAESLLVTKTLISLLRAGVTPDLALKMINTVMLMKDDEESYATVDLAIIDRISGKVKFYKIGAAPTLIRHRETVEEVKLSAVPLGIVNGLKIRYMETELKKDDWIIMMSDGVSDGGAAGSTGRDAFIDTLKSTVAKVRSADPEMMSMLLIDQAADSYIGRERDDLTVLAAHIS